MPLQGAPLGRRVLAAVLDGLVVAGACAVFGFTFWQVTEWQIPGWGAVANGIARLELFAVASALASLLWAASQYLLIVYSGTTPGIRLAGLKLCRFDGSSADRRLRRWRVLASYLSAVSLGMGYLWVFLDEDCLCWHDRITHTYLAPKIRNS